MSNKLRILLLPYEYRFFDSTDAVKIETSVTKSRLLLPLLLLLLLLLL